MNTDVLVLNVFNLFIIAIILEFTVMSIFSLSILKNMSENTLGKSIRDGIILAVAIFICVKVPTFSLFRKTGIERQIPKYLDYIISALVLTRMTIIIRNFIDKIKESNA